MNVWFRNAHKISGLQHSLLSEMKSWSQQKRWDSDFTFKKRANKQTGERTNEQTDEEWDYECKRRTRSIGLSDITKLISNHMSLQEKCSIHDSLTHCKYINLSLILLYPWIHYLLTTKILFKYRKWCFLRLKLFYFLQQ